MSADEPQPPRLTFGDERRWNASDGDWSYQHWLVTVEPPLGILSMNVAADGGAFGAYALKLNSYDIGVDIELAAIVRRIRFEHPDVGCVVINSTLEGVFCAGANIQMLAAATHHHKVNFCKFTNETRLEIEEASRCSGLRFLAAVNGACSGGGYELALACDHILLVDDQSSAVSLPELPLLGVLPGTGGLTRVTDKRHVRRDLADLFATRAEGVRGQEALDWGLVDEIVPPSQFDAAVRDRAMALAATSDRDPTSAAVEGFSLHRNESDGAIDYQHVHANFAAETRSVTVTVTVTTQEQWPLVAARELDDLLCHLRFNCPELATIVIKTHGSLDDVLGHDQAIAEPRTHRERETSLLWKRVLSRLDLTARSIIAAIEPGSCFGGILAELALAADRSYMLDGIFEDDNASLPPAQLALSSVSLGPMPMANGLTRLESRFWGRNGEKETAYTLAAGADGPRRLDAEQAIEHKLVTATPDDLDWDDELRLALEERATFSPDALTAMEANIRFVGPETLATKIFGRLSAWQNWIFTRPNASGPAGALRRYGTGTRPDYDKTRT